MSIQSKWSVQKRHLQTLKLFKFPEKKPPSGIFGHINDVCHFAEDLFLNSIRVRFTAIVFLREHYCIKTFKEVYMICMQCYKWFKHFKWNILYIHKESRLEQSWTSTNNETINVVPSVIRTNHRLAMLKIVEEIRISVAFCLWAERLGMHRFTAKLAPLVPTVD